MEGFCFNFLVLGSRWLAGGVTSMPSFLAHFFPSVVLKMKSAHESEYCKFDSELLTLFTSSLYLAALVASFGASIITRKFGRKPSMFFGGLSFLIGSILNGVANSIVLLIIGRLLLGVGVGFANQVLINRQMIYMKMNQFNAVFAQFD